MPLQSIGARLKALRQQKNKTQDEVAKSLGITRARYSHFENDRNEPDNEMLATIADYYEVSIDYLLGHSDVSNSSPDWATEADRIDLAKLLESSTPMGYDEMSWDENDKKKVQKVIEGIYWDRLKEMREKGQK